MIKIKFENLLVSIVVSVVIFFNTISTTMLDRTFLDAKANYLLLVILLLGLRFIFPKRISFKYLIFSSLLLLSGILVYFQTGKLNFLVYSALLVLLVDVDMKVVLKTYLIVAGILVLSVFILSLLGAVPNLQYNREGVIRNSFGFIYPTDFASHCFYIFLAFSYLLKDKFIWIRSLIGLLLSFSSSTIFHPSISKLFQSTNLAKTNSYKNNFDYFCIDYSNTNFLIAALLFPLS